MLKQYRKKVLIAFGGLFLIGGLLLSGCSTANKVTAEKTGAQLWGENCVRCHNAPSPPAFSDVQWETVALHMRIRANLTKEEVDKIVEFLKMAN